MTFGFHFFLLVIIKSDALGNASKENKNFKNFFISWTGKIFNWMALDQACPANISLNGTILREKSMEISLRLDITGFPYQMGVLVDSKRQNLAYRSVCDESASIKPQLMIGKGTS